MREYLTSFDPRIRALTGSPEQIARMADLFHIHVKRIPGKDGDYTLEHSAAVELFDRNGKIVGEIGYNEDEKSALASSTPSPSPANAPERRRQPLGRRGRQHLPPFVIPPSLRAERSNPG